MHLAALSLSEGLSPLVRGKLDEIRHPGCDRGSIPACAGETGFRKKLILLKTVYPRLCGGNGAVQPTGCDDAGLSPLVRGKPPKDDTATTHPGSIPACAGETAIS